jgi:hypothetical protein
MLITWLCIGIEQGIFRIPICSKSVGHQKKSKWSSSYKNFNIKEGLRSILTGTINLENKSNKIIC